jgi:hypothetical protein
MKRSSQRQKLRQKRHLSLLKKHLLLRKRLHP